MVPIEEQIKNVARGEGFCLVGIATAGPSDGFDRYLDWLNRGYRGEMAYLVEHAQARRRPDSVLADVRSVIMVAVDDDPPPEPNPAPPLRETPPTYPARVARFARGRDYHRAIWDRLTRLQEW